MFPKKIPKLRKNTKRSISKEAANEVLARDGWCIIPKCGQTIQEIHHAYYGYQSNYSENRNDPDQLVGLCNKCHDSLHSRGGEGLREYCIEYLLDIYEGK